MRLSDARVRNAKPSDKPYKLSDGNWLYLTVQPNGSKLWRMNYRILGRQRTLAIGPYPEIGLQMARERASDARKLLAQGIDPSEHKQAQAKAARLAASNTFEAIGREYIARDERQGLAPTTLERKRWILEKIVFPQIGHRQITELRPSDILEVLSDLESRNQLETAKRTRQIISGVFRLAALTDRVMADPTTVLQRVIRAPQHTGHPAVVHETGFGELMRKIARYPSPLIRLALEFQAHTFVRPGELRFATWDEIDMEDSVWRIPPQRMKMRRPHDVPLVHATRTILRDVRRITGRTEGLIFPSPQSWRKPISENTLNKALAILGYKGKHTSHGFRSSASTILNERGYRKDVIEFQLAHVEENEVRRAYNRAQYWDERVALMKAWADIIASLRTGESAGSTASDRKAPGNSNAGQESGYQGLLTDRPSHN